MAERLDLTAKEYFSYFDALHDVTLAAKESFDSVVLDQRGHLIKSSKAHMPRFLTHLIELIGCMWDQKHYDSNQEATDKKFFFIVQQIHDINAVHKKLRRYFVNQMRGAITETNENDSIYTLRAMRLYTSYVDFFKTWNEQIEAYVETHRSISLRFNTAFMRVNGLFPIVNDAELIQNLSVEGIGFYKKHERIALPSLNKPLCEMFADMCKRVREGTQGIINGQQLRFPVTSLKILGGIFANEAAARLSINKLSIYDPHVHDLLRNNALMGFMNPYLDRSAIEDYLETLHVLIGNGDDVRSPKVEGRFLDFNGDIAPVLEIITHTSRSLDALFDIISVIRHHFPGFDQELNAWIESNLIDKLRTYCSKNPRLDIYQLLIWLRMGTDFLKDFPTSQTTFKGYALLFLRDLIQNNYRLAHVSRAFAEEFLQGEYTPTQVINDIIPLSS